MSISDSIQKQTTHANNPFLRFPKSFVWGVATAAYQIEGATEEDGRGESIWDRFARTPGKTYQGETGNIAIDHYHRMEDDVALMASMGMQSYRFSVSWPRILPTGTGQVNDKGLDFYDRLVDTLLRNKITPFLTLYHWDLPQALEDRGGWLSRDTAYAFADYAEIMARRLGDRVEWWITHNEPFCAAFNGYGCGLHAPGIIDHQKAIQAGHYILLSHGLAVPRLRATIAPTAKVGITLNFTPVYTADETPATREVYQRLDAFNNRWFIEPIYQGTYPAELFSHLGVHLPNMEPTDMKMIMTPIDFLGVNYYSRMVVKADAAREKTSTGTYQFEYVYPIPDATYTAMQWEVFPDGLRDLLLRLWNEYHPTKMFITENGAAYADIVASDGHIYDNERLMYLDKHIEAIWEANQQGAPVQGYFLWSFTDNYEWMDGYSKRFGVVYIDYATQRRIVKESGHWYSSLIAYQRESTQTE